MFRTLNNIIENEVTESELDFYSVIIGTKPSQGARSPKLWNKVYDHEGKKIRMIPLDIKEKKLERLFNYLQEDKHCLGGAIAVPFKEKVFSFIESNLTKEIKSIGAINCFHRSTPGLLINDFTGTNTDGEAALEPIKEYLTKNKNLTIALLGFGGAGKAILAFLIKDYKKKHNIQVFNRSLENIKNLEKIGLSTHSLNDIEKYLPRFDLLINATSVGHKENVEKSLISSQSLKTAKKTLVVYDIIYDPVKTYLLKNSEENGLKTVNGMRMNLIQAVLAFSYTNPTSLSIEQIYEAMI